MNTFFSRTHSFFAVLEKRKLQSFFSASAPMSGNFKKATSSSEPDRLWMNSGLWHPEASISS